MLSNLFKRIGSSLLKGLGYIGISFELGSCVLFGAAFLLLFPLSSHIVDQMVERSLRDKTQHVVNVIRSAPNFEEMVAQFKRQPPLLHRVTIFKTGGVLVYDSEEARFLAMRTPEVYMSLHPEVPQAFDKGYGYGQFYSETLQKILVHMALRVDDFNGETLVIRTAFPLDEVEMLTQSFRKSFMLVGLALLCACLLIVILLSHRLSTRSAEEGGKSAEEIDQFEEICTLRERVGNLTLHLDEHIDLLKDERKEKYQLLSLFKDPIVVLDQSGMIEYMNPPSLDLLENQIDEESEEGLLLRRLQDKKFPIQLTKCTELPSGKKLLHLEAKNAALLV